MTKDKKILAIIPARGGSKGIPKKNLFPIMGIPLLQYTLEAVKKSNYVNQVLVSTEDQEIKEFASVYGFSTDYLRPDALATDEATTIDAVLDGINWITETGEAPDIVILLQPTSPLRTAEHIDQAIESFIDNDCSSLVSVHKMIEHPYKCLKQIDRNNWSFLAKPATEVSRRQDYNNDFYAINGAIYIVKPKWLQEHHNFVSEAETSLFEMTPVSGVDVDDLSDIFQVEAYLRMTAEGKE